MWAVLLLGVLGVVWTFTFPPAWALVKGQTWAIDLWCLSGVAIALAALIGSTSVRHLACPLAALAGAAVSLFAALAADPNAQGPGFNVLAMLCDVASIGCAIAILGRSDLRAFARG